MLVTSMVSEGRMFTCRTAISNAIYEYCISNENTHRQPREPWLTLSTASANHQTVCFTWRAVVPFHHPPIQNQSHVPKALLPTKDAVCPQSSSLGTRHPAWSRLCLMQELCAYFSFAAGLQPCTENRHVHFSPLLALYKLFGAVFVCCDIQHKVRWVFTGSL